jgi:hypothetical protein
MVVVHSGFDGLKVTIQADIPLELRGRLIEAKKQATLMCGDCVIDVRGLGLAVRRSGGMAFSAHTGEYGAEFYFLDPENRAPNNPGVTVDFRAFLLATGGLQAAKDHLDLYIGALGISYETEALRVSRVDFAVDILAPWFEPNRDALVVPPGTKVTERTGIDETETNASGPRVTGLRAGAIANRQLAIYDKRAEVSAKGKMGWVEIWNDKLGARRLPLIDLSDRMTSQIWRFEMRMGSKQLRNRWAMHGWDDLNEKIGDAYIDFCEHIRYCQPTADSNRSRWPSHQLWEVVCRKVSNDMSAMVCGATPNSVKEANLAEHQDHLQVFLTGHVLRLLREAERHPVTPRERMAKSVAKYSFR